MFETKQIPKGKTTYSVEFKWRTVQMFLFVCDDGPRYVYAILWALMNGFAIEK